MTSPLMVSEPTGVEAFCAVGLSDRHNSGRCQDRNCGRVSTALLNGYCLQCATRRNINPTRTCCPPIKLSAPASNQG